MIYDISSISFSFWYKIQNLKKNRGTAVFSFQFLFFCSFHFFSMHHILQEKTLYVSCSWGHLGDLVASTRTAVHFPHLGRSHRCLWQSQGAVNLNGERLLQLKNPYTEATLKMKEGTYELLVCLRLPKDFPCWHMWTCGVWNRGLVWCCSVKSNQVIYCGWRWLKPFRLGHSQIFYWIFNSAIGQGWWNFQHDKLRDLHFHENSPEARLWTQSFCWRTLGSAEVCLASILSGLDSWEFAPSADPSWKSAMLVLFPTVFAQLLADSSWRSFFACTITVNESLWGTQVGCKMIYLQCT